jgi:hypothetical protein
MTGFDNLFPKNMQAEYDIDLVNLNITIISANLFSKVKQAFQPAYAAVLA